MLKVEASTINIVLNSYPYECENKPCLGNICLDYIPIKKSHFYSVQILCTHIFSSMLLYHTGESPPDLTLPHLSYQVHFFSQCLQIIVIFYLLSNLINSINTNKVQKIFWQTLTNFVHCSQSDHFDVSSKKLPSFTHVALQRI